MNDGTAAVTELVVGNSSGSMARAPEQEIVEQFHNSLATDNAVESVSFEEMQAHAIGAQEPEDGLPANGVVDYFSRQDPVDVTTDPSTVEPIVSQTENYSRYSYQLSEGGTNPFVESIASVLDRVDARQESVAERFNLDMPILEKRAGESGETNFANNVEFLWNMQRTTMEVQAWTVEIGLMSSSVSKSLSGVQTLFRSGG